MSMAPDNGNFAGEIFTVATCASNLSNGSVKLLLPGETTASAKYYKVLNNVGISNGARVICVRMSGTWVVLGGFNAGGGGGGGGGNVPIGGNAGDLLAKASSVNYDAVWLTPASAVEQDNTRPITSAAVYTEVGNINALLATI